METLQKELQALKPWDKVENTTWPDNYQGYPKINKAGHGYLAVYRNDMNAKTAENRATFFGEKAFYLEEDCDATAFLDAIS